ncbi:ParA family protein [Imperialibacter roseus]|uniref:ParA family protein n=1 Tax=Imperialibacter roseus TaxID=1324217 RepID=A0ABZ0IQ71_9BACT|nr:ParA family protein [Imperialibacter roseus]WOK07188.1 ParA family protein [Imperialibacter roseus]
MTKVISILNEKGGVGKTTTTSSLGSILASRGFKVVMLDLDPQADLTLACKKAGEATNIYDILFETKKVTGINVNPNLVLIPGSNKMAATKFKTKIQDEYSLMHPITVLRSVFKSLLVRDDIHFVLIDCPPNLDLVVQNALAMSTHVLIPIVAHSFAVNGAWSIVDFIKKFRESDINPELAPVGILMNSFDQRLNIHRGVYELCLESFPNLLFDTKIRVNTKLAENTHLGQEIVTYAKALSEGKFPNKFSGFEDFTQLADELLDRLGYKELAI